MTMKIYTRFVTTVFLFSLFVACSPVAPEKTRAARLIEETSKLAEDSRVRLRSEKIMEKLQRIEANRKGFPATRGALGKDAADVKRFFLTDIEADRRIIDKFEAVLEIGLVEHEAQCLRATVKFLTASIEPKKSVAAQMELYADEAVKEREVLDAKISSIREAVKAREAEISKLETRMDEACARKKL